MALYHWSQVMNSPYLIEVDRMNRPRIACNLNVLREPDYRFVDDPDLSMDGRVRREDFGLERDISNQITSIGSLLDELKNYLKSFNPYSTSFDAPYDFSDTGAGDAHNLYVGTMPDKADAKKPRTALIEIKGGEPEYDFGSRVPVRQMYSVQVVTRGQPIDDGGYKDAREVNQLVCDILGSIWQIRIPATREG